MEDAQPKAVTSEMYIYFNDRRNGRWKDRDTYGGKSR